MPIDTLMQNGNGNNLANLEGRARFLEDNMLRMTDLLNAVRITQATMAECIKQLQTQTQENLRAHQDNKDTIDKVVEMMNLMRGSWKTFAVFGSVLIFVSIMTSTVIEILYHAH